MSVMSSIFRIARYEKVNDEHIITFMEQHREFSKMIESRVPVQEGEGPLETIAALAWSQVKDDFDAWRASIDQGRSITNRFFEVNDQGNLIFL